MEDYDPNEKTYPCKVCGRKFVRSSLQKHEPACKKLQKLSRKVFDSGKQRAVGSDVPITAVRKAQKEKEKHGGVFPRPKTHWRERHEEFIGAVSGAKHVERALKTGGPLPPPPKTSFHPDYVKCDYCGRSFNQRAAERHIPFCREQNARTGAAATPKTSGGGKSRSQSQPRTNKSPPSRSPSQSRSSSRRPSTKGPVSPGSTGYGRAPTTGASMKGRPIANSAGVRTSHLPTPVKRSNSAPRTAHAPKTPGTAHSQYGSSSSSTSHPQYGASSTSSRKSIPTSNGRIPSNSKPQGGAGASGRRPSQTRTKRQQ